MNSKLKLVVLSWLLPLLAARVAGQGVPGEPPERTFSENRKYAVEISESELNNPKLTVFKLDGDAAAILWSRNLFDESAEDSNQAQMELHMGHRKWVANDGSAVVFRPGASMGMQAPALRVFTRSKGNKAFTLRELRPKTVPAAVVEEDVGFAGRGVVELFLEEKTPPLYARWEQSGLGWMVLNLGDLKLAEATPAQTAELEAKALAKSRERVRAHQPDTVRRWVNRVQQQAGRMLPGLVPQPQVQMGLDEGLDAAYRYLAHRKQPEDKRYIEGLLQHPLNSSAQDLSGVTGFTAGVHSSERALGDELLAAWEGKFPEQRPSPVEWNGFAFLANTRPVYLGGVAGTVWLPFEIFDEFGPASVYLIPAQVPQGEWQGHAEVVAVHAGHSAMRHLGVAKAESDHYRFYFDTLTPGEYRLKAVWRRGAGDGSLAQANRKPEPGDYESRESEPFTIKAGQRLTNFGLECTNRVAGREALYARDEAWAKDHPALREPDDPPFRPWAGQEAKVLFSAPVAQWVIKTNRVDDALNLERIQVVVPAAFGEEPQRCLAVRFGLTGPDTMTPSVEAQLIDEHGCSFSSQGAIYEDRTMEVRFTVIPCGSREFRLQLKREDYSNGAASPSRGSASYQLTNLFAVQPVEWPAAPAPVRAKAGDLDVELKSFDAAVPETSSIIRQGARPMRWSPSEYHAMMTGNARPALRSSELVFTQDGQPAPGWRKNSGKFRDRWGNESRNINEFCKNEESFEYSISLLRDPRQAKFTDAERWEIPLEKLPGAGEFLRMDLSNTIQGLEIKVFGVGGTGQFTYRKGRLRSAQAEFSNPSSSLQFLMPDQSAVPRLNIVNGPRGRAGRMTAMAMPPFGGASAEVELEAQIPHLVCRIPHSDEVLVELLERDASVEEPLNARPATDPFGGVVHYSHGGPPSHSSYRLIPLNANLVRKKLTFVVQKPRSAEMYLRVPKEARKAAEEP